MSRHSRVVALLILLFGGCRPAPPPASSGSEPAEFRQYRQEALTVILSLSETNILSSGSIQLSLEAHAPGESQVAFPHLSPLIPPFVVTESRLEPVRELANGRYLHRQVWTLSPGLPGEYSLPPLDVQAETLSVRTDPLSIGVRSVLPDEVDQLAIKDITPPVDLLPKQRRSRLAGLAVLGTGILLAGLVVLRQRIGRALETPALSPHARAFRALEQLPDEGLARLGALTGILLTFVEERFLLPTSGKTIEEILPALTDELVAGHRQSLETFLTTAEHARFSHSVPPRFCEDGEQTVRQFIESTPPEDVPCA